MVDLLKKVLKTSNFLLYRFRYLINYIIIGFFSIIIEILIISFLNLDAISPSLEIMTGFSVGVLFAFLLNAQLNFKVPKEKNMRTFIFFLIISVLAFVLNLFLIGLIENFLRVNYAYLRLITAATIFMLSYTLHRKITFDFIKKVGLAVYLNKGENISEIYSKIRYYSDFIHIDLIDNSFKKDAQEIDISLVKKIDSTWGLKKFLHIMSKTPSVWIEKLSERVDVIIFHLEIDEPINEIIKICKRRGKKIGIALNLDSKTEELYPFLQFIDFVQVMGIEKLGESGNEFKIESLKKLEEVNKLKKQYNYEVIFDGGVRTTNISKINAEYIVSSSGILSSKNPIQSFMELKTSSRYASLDKKLKRNIFLGIRKTIESIDFVEACNIVGTFSEGKNLNGLNDIDIVIIIDDLKKKKFKIILDKFTKLKKEIESKYAYPVFINTTFGPIKFNEKSIVFHLMVYDKKSHKKHCMESPFTCFDWQRSKLFIKRPIYEIYKVSDLQLNNFFNSRRGAEDYLADIKSNRISYREYEFKDEKVLEVKKYRDMNKRDRIEFSFHISKFLISNFLKIYFFKNEIYPLKDMLDKYFKIFPINKKVHKEKIIYLSKLKEEKRFIDIPWIINWLELFIMDFEYQFKELFEIK